MQSLVLPEGGFYVAVHFENGQSYFLHTDSRSIFPFADPVSDKCVIKKDTKDSRSEKRADETAKRGSKKRKIGHSGGEI